MVMTPVSSATLSAVPPTKTGVVTGMYNTLRFTGATIGVAVLGAIQVNVQDDLFSESLKKNGATATLDPSIFEGLLNGLPHSLEAAKALSADSLAYVKGALIEASTVAFSLTNSVTGVVALLALVITRIAFKKT